MCLIKMCLTLDVLIINKDSLLFLTCEILNPGPIACFWELKIPHGIMENVTSHTRGLFLTIIKSMPGQWNYILSTPDSVSKFIRQILWLIPFFLCSLCIHPVYPELHVPWTIKPQFSPFQSVTKQWCIWEITLRHSSHLRFPLTRLNIHKT